MIKNSKPLHPGLVLSEVYMAEMWVRMLADYDLWVARKKAA